MASRYPYTNTPGNLRKAIEQFRKNFPRQVTVNTLKQLGIARNNERHILRVLNFLELINDDGNRTDPATQIFSIHNSTQFSQQFSEHVKKFYSGLFELHGDSAWTLDRDELIQFFRQTDHTSENVGKLQASTFQTIAELAGYSEVSKPKSDTPRPTRAPKKSEKKATVKPKKIKEGPPLPITPAAEDEERRNFGLTVRIEINLPAAGDQETYDNIFRSIRENLLND